MLKSMRYLLFSLLFLPILSLSKEDISQASLISPHSQIQKGEESIIGIRITVPIGWYSYWSNPGEFGQEAKVKWKHEDKVKITPLPFPIPERDEAQIGKEKSYSFIHKQELLIPFKILVNKSYKKDTLFLKADFEWSYCKDICLTTEDEISLTLNVGEDLKSSDDKAIFDFWENHFPEEGILKPVYESSSGQERLHFFFDKPISCLDIFPLSTKDFSPNHFKVLNETKRSCSFEIDTKSLEKKKRKKEGLFVYIEEGKKKASLFEASEKLASTLLFFILMAFLGGLILNIMPCVLPIIFVKFYNVIQMKNLSKKRLFALNFSYCVGVTSSFLALALFILISQKVGGRLGWGFHLQSPGFVSFLALVFLLMGFYLLGFFKISLPKVSLSFKDEKMISQFFTGVLSTTAASPCTVPFMAPAVGWAFSRQSFEVLTIFLFLGIGLSFPYLLLSFFPQALKYVPYPSRKMELLKKWLALPLFLTFIWLFYVLERQLSLPSFLLSVLIFSFLTLFIISLYLKKLKFDKILSLVFLSVAVFSFASQMIYDFSFKKEVKIDDKHSSPFKGLGWQNFDEQSILFDKNLGKNVFVGFGAKWCLTCKFNERFFTQKDFQDFTTKNQIQLYYGDLTDPNPDIIRFLEKYGQRGVPFYIFLKKDKFHIFPTLLTKKTFLKKLEELSQ